MKCQGNFIFKTLTLRKAGVFRNDEGQDVNYPSAYILKVDEISDNGEINERKFKIEEKKTSLINDFRVLEAYQKIILKFDVTIYATRIALDLTDVEVDFKD